MKSSLFYICCIFVFSTCLFSMEKKEVVQEVVEKMLGEGIIRIPDYCYTKTNFIALIVSKLSNELTYDVEAFTLSIKKIALQESGTGGAYFQMPIKRTGSIGKQTVEVKTIIGQNTVQAVVETKLEEKQGKLPDYVNIQSVLEQKVSCNPKIDSATLSLYCDAEASQQLLHAEQLLGIENTLPISTNACERARKTKTKAIVKKNKNGFVHSNVTNNKDKDDFGFMFDEEL